MSKENQNLKLKGAIVGAGFTYSDLAKLSDVKTPTIQRAVNGKNISIDNAKAICSALGKNLDEIFGDKEG